MESHFPSDKNAPSKFSKEEDEISPKTLETCRDMVSALPRENGWKAYGDICFYQGFWCYSYLLEGAIFAQDHYKAQPTDIFICSVPKSGTTWLKSLTFAIVTRTQFDNSTSPLLNQNPHNCVPLLEIDFSRKGIKPEPGSLPLMSTHLPYASLPKSIIDSGLQEPMSLEETFELFCKGFSDYGPYWDHLLGYWKASLEQPEKILFLKYEDLIKDTSFYVKKMAEFMGYPFSLEEEKEGKIQDIVQFCSFENMSNLEISKTGKYSSDSILVEIKTLYRKGKIGDWKNCLTPEMAERLDKITEQKLGEFGLSFAKNDA
ncbi:hypothetical protein Patl1_32755 [Pistacia atlantica]|uniref:Uncharacterized protein n=1 Tax=Pistacia atlantica TaxID=434234 RepID=A0ACC1ANX0_9ROSI|nr:hypothetical protein Patl1_32755 [Pistacia atlantica]